MTSSLSSSATDKVGAVGTWVSSGGVNNGNSMPDVVDHWSWGTVTFGKLL